MTLAISTAKHSKDPQPAPTVRQVQNLLIAKGYSVGRYGADGQFGKDSDTATRRFQAHEGLERDGVVGPKTYAALKDGQPNRPPNPASDAARMADLAYRLVTQGIDGTRPTYVFGAETDMHNPSPDRLDCSELVQWAVTQIDGHTWVDGSAAQYSAGKHISVHEGIRTKGALLFRTGNGMPSGIHHVVVSMGDKRTAEARSTRMGCGSWAITDESYYHFACLIPVLTYS